MFSDIKVKEANRQESVFVTKMSKKNEKHQTGGGNKDNAKAHGRAHKDYSGH